MRHLIVLHVNDTHGRLEGLARVATLVSETRQADPGTSVLFFDIGDVEEPSQRLSNLTKGTAMHRLLGRAGCNAAVVGNGAWFRYGPQILAEQAAAAPYPLLLANLTKRNGEHFDGVQPTTLLDVPGLRLGLIGLSAIMPNMEAFFDIASLEVLPLVRQLVADLKKQGARAIIILSHLGLPADETLAAALENEALATEALGNEALADEILAIIGGHTHTLLPEGKQVGKVWIAQAGNYAEHLGRIELEYDESQVNVTAVGVIQVTDEVPQSPEVLAEAEIVEQEIGQYLDEVVGELAQPLDYATDRECGTVDLLADVLRDRMQAEVGLVAAGQAFGGPLTAGPLRRGMLWDVCSSSANPGVTMMTGDQLRTLIQRGLDPAFAAERPRSLRGQERGFFHLSGASMRDGSLFVGDRPVEPEQQYRVAGSDWELEPYGGYALDEWNLQVHYDMPTILREALEDYLRGRGPVAVEMGRIGETREVKATVRE